MTQTRSRAWIGRRGFTLIDLMIVIVILAIRAAIVLPLFNNYVKDASEASANSTYDSVRKALDVHYMEHGAWPEEITSSLFANGEPVTLPDGYAFDYSSTTGSLELVFVKEDEEEEEGGE